MATSSPLITTTPTLSPQRPNSEPCSQSASFHIVLHPSINEPLCHIATGGSIFAAASEHHLTTFLISDFQAPNESLILAEWFAPSDYSIRCLALSPDGKVLALLLADCKSAALLLLCPRSLQHLLRIALPWKNDAYPNIVFFSRTALRIRDQKNLREALLPKHLRGVFVEADLSTNLHGPGVSSLTCERSDAAPYALAVSVQPMIIYSFSSQYMRVSSFSTHMPLKTASRLISIPCLPGNEFTPVLHESTFLHTLEEPLLPISDLNVVKLLALCREQPALLALIQLSSNRLAAAVFHRESVTITPLAVNAANDAVFVPDGKGGCILRMREQEVIQIATITLEPTLGFRVSPAMVEEGDMEREDIHNDNMDNDKLRRIIHRDAFVMKLHVENDVVHVEGMSYALCCAKT